MTTETSPLEQRITEAFAEWADLVDDAPPEPKAVESTPHESPRRPRRRLLVTAGAAVVVLVTALGIGFWTRRDSEPASRDASGHVVDGRLEVVLHRVPITPELRRSLLANDFDFGSDQHPIALRPEGHEALVVFASNLIDPPFTSPQAPTREGCLSVAVPTKDGFFHPNTSCGFQFGALAPPAGVPTADVHDMHADARPKLAYSTWTNVPDGATRVTYDSPTVHAWQTPVRGVAVFPVPVDQGPTLRAYAADGRLLAEHVIEAPEFPSAGYVGPNPAWYDLKATLRFCKEAPLDQVDFVIGGNRGRFRMFDPTGGIADVDAREFCAQNAELRPEPQSDIRRSLAVVAGAIQIRYYRLVDPNAPDVEANRSVLPDEELRAINAARRAEVTPICKTRSKASFKIPACQIGG